MSTKVISAGDSPKPFVKWAGGKRQLLKELTQRLPSAGKYKCMNYFEIFGGGGALLFSIDKNEICRKLYLSDSNEELINAYRVIRDDVENLIKSLSKHKADKDYFYQIRDWDRSPNYSRRTKLNRASRFLYLNKTAYNGLYRVNSRGQFNAPYGYYVKPKILDADNLRVCSAFLRNVHISASDFQETLSQISAFDFVYMDPPYAPVSSTSNFTSYTPKGFSESEQDRLRDFCKSLHEKGALFMLSNSSAPWVINLYKKEKSFVVEKVRARRSVNCKSEGRGEVEEIIVRNYR